MLYIYYNLFVVVNFIMIKSFLNFDIDYFKMIEDKIFGKTSVTYEEIDYYLSYVVYSVREKIFDNSNYFVNKCDLAQSIICHYFNSIGVINYPNMTLNAITDYIIGHSFVVATFNVMNENVNYLIDPTYIQFFKSENCSPDRYVMFNNYIIRTPDPGYYIKEGDRDIINKFNYCGYGVLNEELAKIYGDSFYNTKTMVMDKEYREMNGFVYINSFLKGREKLSKTVDDLVRDGYYLDFKSDKLKLL